MNNRASAWILSLPLEERDARRRYARVRETTEHLKRTRQARGAQILAELVRARRLAHVPARRRAADAAPEPVQPDRHERARARRCRSICSARGSSRAIRWSRCSRTRASASRSSATTTASSGASTPTGTWCPTCITSRTTWRRRSRSSTRSRRTTEVRTLDRPSCVLLMIDLVLRSVLTPGVLAARWAGLVQLPVDRRRAAARAGRSGSRRKLVARRGVLPDRGALDAAHLGARPDVASPRR